MELLEWRTTFGSALGGYLVHLHGWRHDSWCHLWVLKTLMVLVDSALFLAHFPLLLTSSLDATPHVYIQSQSTNIWDVTLQLGFHSKLLSMLVVISIVERYSLSYGDRTILYLIGCMDLHLKVSLAQDYYDRYSIRLVSQIFHAFSQRLCLCCSWYYFRCHVKGEHNLFYLSVGWPEEMASNILYSMGFYDFYPVNSFLYNFEVSRSFGFTWFVIIHQPVTTPYFEGCIHLFSSVVDFFQQWIKQNVLH